MIRVDDHLVLIQSSPGKWYGRVRIDVEDYPVWQWLLPDGTLAEPHVLSSGIEPMPSRTAAEEAYAVYLLRCN